MTTRLETPIGKWQVFETLDIQNIVPRYIEYLARVQMLGRSKMQMSPSRVYTAGNLSKNRVWDAATQLGVVTSWSTNNRG